MSSFTRFDERLNIEFSIEASTILNKDYWLLKKAFTFYIDHVDSNRIVRVPRGFLSDGTTIPAWVRVLVPVMGRHSQAVFLHDYLCETYKVLRLTNGLPEMEDIDRDEVDRIFYQALEVSDIPKWRITLIRLGTTVYRKIAKPKRPKTNPDKIAMESILRKRLRDQEAKHHQTSP